MLNRLLLIFLLCFCSILSQAQLKSPTEFLPHTFGEQFTPHYMLVDYVQHVAANSPKVKLVEYGRTNQDRPLLMAYISTPENLARLERIREANLKRTGLLVGDAGDDDLTHPAARCWRRPSQKEQAP